MNVNYEVDKKEPKLVHHYSTEFWQIKIPDKASNDLKKELEYLVDKRRDYATKMYAFFIEKMKMVPQGEKGFNPAMLRYEETLLAIIQKWKDNVKLREVSNQKDIPEFTEQLLKKKEEAKKVSIVLKGPGKPIKVKKN